eukprot:126297-Pelagomonas_calceolata.AAC.11
MLCTFTSSKPHHLRAVKNAKDKGNIERDCGDDDRVTCSYAHCSTHTPNPQVALGVIEQMVRMTELGRWLCAQRAVSQQERR